MTVTLLALAVLAAFYVSVLVSGKFDFPRWALNVGADGAELPNGGGAWLPTGIGGVLASLPFAVWLFLAIEQLPLAAEESHDPKRDMPKGIIAGICTLIVSAFLVLFLNSGIAPGAAALAKSGEPLLDGFRTLFGTDIAKILAAVAVIGLIASFHTIIFAFGRQIYSLSRAGYFPSFLSVTHGTHKTPHLALIAGAVIGLVVMLIIWFSVGSEAGAGVIGGTLLNMAVAGAMLAYFMQGMSYIQLKRKFPHIERPYVSPFGVAGAGATMVIAAVTLYFQLTDPVFRAGVFGVAIYYAVMMAYFMLIGRHKLILSPEEEFALTKGTAEYKSLSLSPGARRRAPGLTLSKVFSNGCSSDQDGGRRGGLCAQPRPEVRQGRRLRRRRRPARQIHLARQVRSRRWRAASASATSCWAGIRTTSSTTT